MFYLLLCWAFGALKSGNGQSNELRWFFAYDDFYDERLDGVIISDTTEEEQHRPLRDNMFRKMPVQGRKSSCSSLQSGCILMEGRSSFMRATNIDPLQSRGQKNSSAAPKVYAETSDHMASMEIDIFKSKYIELPITQRLKVGTRVRVRTNSNEGEWISGHITRGPPVDELLGPSSIYKVTHWTGISNEMPRYQINALRDFEVGDEIYGSSAVFGWLAGHIVGDGIRSKGYVDVNFDGNIHANDWESATLMFRELRPKDRVYCMIPEEGWKLGFLEYAVDAEQTKWVVQLDENEDRWKLDRSQIMHKEILEKNAQLVEPPLYQAGDKVRVKLQNGWSDGVITSVNVDSTYMIKFANSHGSGLREPLVRPATQEVKERVEKEKLLRASQPGKKKEVVRIVEDKKKESQL